MFLFLVSFPVYALDKYEGSGATTAQEVASLLHGLPLLLPCVYQPFSQQTLPQQSSVPSPHHLLATSQAA